MRHNLCLITLVLLIACSVSAHAEPTPIPTQEVLDPDGPTLTVVEATLDEIRGLPLPEGEEDLGPTRRFAELTFRYPRWYSTGERVASHTAGGLDVKCKGLVDFEAAQIRRGDRVCLYAAVSTDENWLCNGQRWYLAANSDCEDPVFVDSSMSCTRMGDRCEKMPGSSPYELVVRPYRAAKNAVDATVIFDRMDAVGGYLLVGGTVLGIKPRARVDGDVNEDGLRDTIVVRAGETTVTVYLGRRNELPLPVSMLDLERGACALTIGQFGGDASADVAVEFCTEDGKHRDGGMILVGDGKGNFVPAP